VKARFRKAAAGLAAAAILLLSPAARAQSGGSAEIKTPLHTLAKGESFVLRAVETLDGAPDLQLAVTFFDEGGRLVKQVNGSFGPGRPARFEIARSELGGRGPTAAVRAVARLSRDGGFRENQALLSFEFFKLRLPTDRCGGLCTICQNPDFACLPSSQGGAEVSCEGGAAVTDFVAGQ
jgi:hypothetical protein